MNLKPKDIEVSLVQSDHEQNVGRWSMQTYSGVVLYHKPTGIQVRCTTHKSQYKNKAEAVRMLEGEITDKEGSWLQEYCQELINIDESCQKLFDNMERGDEKKYADNLKTLETLADRRYVVRNFIVDTLLSKFKEGVQ